MGFFKDVDDMNNDDLLSEIESLSDESVMEDAGVEEVFSTLNEIDENSEEYINTDSELLEALSDLYNEEDEEATQETIINNNNNEDEMIDTIGDTADADINDSDIVTSDNKEITDDIEEDLSNIELTDDFSSDEIATEPIVAKPIADELSRESVEMVQSVDETESILDEPVISGIIDSVEESKIEVTVITKGTTIKGGITSDCSLEVMGVIAGDVECEGKLSIFGTVGGNADASEIYVNTPVKLTGDLNSTGCVKISEQSKVIGSINAASAFIAGAIKGDIEVTGPVVVDSSAVVLGNITAGSLQLNNGAIIKGICTIATNNTEIDNLFE